MQRKEAATGAASEPRTGDGDQPNADAGSTLYKASQVVVDELAATGSARSGADHRQDFIAAVRMLATWVAEEVNSLSPARERLLCDLFWLTPQPDTAVIRASLADQPRASQVCLNYLCGLSTLVAGGERVSGREEIPVDLVYQAVLQVINAVLAGDTPPLPFTDRYIIVVGTILNAITHPAPLVTDLVLTFAPERVSSDCSPASDLGTAATLASVPCPARLRANEICHATSAAVLYQESNRISRVRYGGFSGRVRIARGISYGLGTYAVDQTRTPKLEEIASGELCVTNQRLVFLSDAKSLDLPFSRLLSCDTGPGEIEVTRANAGRVLFEKLEPALVAVFEQVTSTSSLHRQQIEEQQRAEFSARAQAEEEKAQSNSRTRWLVSSIVVVLLAIGSVAWVVLTGR